MSYYWVKYDGKSHHATLGHYPHIQDTMSLWAWSGGDGGRTILFQILHWIGPYLKLLRHLWVWRELHELCKNRSDLSGQVEMEKKVHYP